MRKSEREKVCVGMGLWGVAKNVREINKVRELKREVDRQTDRERKSLREGERVR